ncbi:hypothetical protein [Streptomyces atroolivaceus]|uniref:hypothetical protein n=1 Tax=Streptomyces atroolivaceus TaxID=66869 RepID=UPI0037AF9B10
MSHVSHVSQASSPPDILSHAVAAGPYGACRAVRESAPLIHHAGATAFSADTGHLAFALGRPFCVGALPARPGPG